MRQWQWIREQEDATGIIKSEIQVQDPVAFASNGSAALDFKGFWAKQGLSAALFWPLHAAMRCSPRKMLNWQQIREETELKMKGFCEN